MATEIFTVKITPLEAQKMIKENIDADLVFSDSYNLGDDKFILITTFEKYYARNNSDAGLIVVYENTTEKTVIKATSTGSAIGVLKIDWGAGGNLLKRVKNILADYII